MQDSECHRGVDIASDHKLIVSLRMCSFGRKKINIRTVTQSQLPRSAKFEREGWKRDRAWKRKRRKQVKHIDNEYAKKLVKPAGEKKLVQNGQTRG